MILLDIPEPENCKDCIFRDYESNMCFASTKDGSTESAEYVDDYMHGDIPKPDWCPASKQLDKIYVITTGEYSDYSVRAATISKEKAEKLRKFHSYGWCNGEARIEEFDINEPHEDLDDLIPVYHVKIYRNGKSWCQQSTWIHERTGKVIEEESYRSLKLGGELQTDVTSIITEYLEFNGYYATKDKEHALKIAQDDRAKLLERYLMDHGEEHEQKLKIAEAKENCHWLYLHGGGMPK